MTDLEFNLLVVLTVILMCGFWLYKEAKSQLNFLTADRDAHVCLADRQEEIISKLEKENEELDSLLATVQLENLSLKNELKAKRLAPPSIVDDSLLNIPTFKQSFKKSASKKHVTFTREQKLIVKQEYAKNRAQGGETLTAMVARLNARFGTEKPYNYFKNVWSSQD